jgi:hypothetical protein
MGAIPAFAGDKLFEKIKLKQTDADPWHFMRNDPDLPAFWHGSFDSFPCSATTVNQLLMARILL